MKPQMDQPFQISLLLWLILCGLFFLTALISVLFGAMPLDVIQALRDWFQGRLNDEVIILREIRLPRMLLAAIVGATLGLAGAAMQGLLRNPLAEPGILGVNGGAVLGAVLVLYYGLYAIHPLALPFGGMAGAFVSVILLYVLSGRMPGIQTLILAGIALNTLFFAGTSLALNLSRNLYSSLEIVFWQMGSVTDRSMDHVLLILPFVLAGWILLLWNSRALDALTLGEEVAASLGVSLRHVKWRLVTGTALAVGACVAISGSIGFIGLVVPHLLRPFVKHEPGRLLGISAIGGAILLMWADLAVRFIPSSTELKLGVLTSLIGAPFFILLVIKLRKTWNGY